MPLKSGSAHELQGPPQSQQNPPLQNVLPQSEGASHTLPPAHGTHDGPPQSTSVSSASFKPFSQCLVEPDEDEEEEVAAPVPVLDELVAPPVPEEVDEAVAPPVPPCPPVPGKTRVPTLHAPTADAPTLPTKRTAKGAAKRRFIGTS